MGKLAKTDTLESVEREIADLSTSIRIGIREMSALVAKVLDEELWRQADYKSGADWGQRHLGLSRQRLQQLVSAHTVLLALPSDVTTIVVNEGQLRALAAVPAEKRVNVIERAKKKGKVTARTIAESVQESEPEVIESETPKPEIEVVPEVAVESSGCERCVELFAENEELRAAVSRLEMAVAAANEGEIPMDEPVDEDEDPLAHLRSIAAGNLPAAPEPVKNCMCRHSEHMYSPGTARFASANRYATICPECLERGHVNAAPQDCTGCQSGFAA